MFIVERSINPQSINHENKSDLEKEKMHPLQASTSQNGHVTCEIKLDEKQTQFSVKYLPCIAVQNKMN